jgi:putative oxidoreductase
MGLMFLAHGTLWKLFQAGPQHTIPCFVGHGSPAAFGWFVIAMKSLGAVALLLGWRVRLVAAALAAPVAGITWHQCPNGWLYTDPLGGWEYRPSGPCAWWR